MTDHPIPDELRDQFLTKIAVAWDWYEVLGAPDLTYTAEYLNAMAERGFHVELRLPEFAVHDDTCCGGSGESCEWKEPVIKAFPSCHERHPEAIVPCPGVAYYHWTRKDEQ